MGHVQTHTAVVKPTCISAAKCYESAGMRSQTALRGGIFAGNFPPARVLAHGGSPACAQRKQVPPILRCRSSSRGVDVPGDTCQRCLLVCPRLKTMIRPCSLFIGHTVLHTSHVLLLFRNAVLQKCRLQLTSSSTATNRLHLSLKSPKLSLCQISPPCRRDNGLFCCGSSGWLAGW